jgi:hypothetical protein
MLPSTGAVEDINIRGIWKVFFRIFSSPTFFFAGVESFDFMILWMTAARRN